MMTPQSAFLQDEIHICKVEWLIDGLAGMVVEADTDERDYLIGAMSELLQFQNRLNTELKRMKAHLTQQDAARGV